MSKPRPLHQRTLRLLPVALALLAGAALPAPAGAQGTPEQREACTSDALKLCMSAIPDVGKTTACMKAHYAELTPRCQASFASTRPQPPAKETIAKAPAPKSERPVAGKAPRVRSAELTERHPRLARPPAARPRRAAEAFEPAEPPPPVRREAPVEGQVVIALPAREAALPGPSRPGDNLVFLCRQGLIDSFTCGSTIPALGLGE